MQALGGIHSEAVTGRPPEASGCSQSVAAGHRRQQPEAPGSNQPVAAGHYAAGRRHPLGDHIAGSRSGVRPQACRRQPIGERA